MSYQRRTSRPSAAGSLSGRINDHELKLECKAIFLTRYDDIRDEIESKNDLVLLLQESGRNAASKIISKYWTRTTESLTFDDFVDICSKERVTSEDDLMRAFRKIDINGDGYISLDELCKIMTTKGEKMSRDEVREMIDEVDENKDGKLDYKEFSRMVVSTTQDFKKMSMKMMERKERKKQRPRDGDITPRRDQTQAHRRGSKSSDMSYRTHDSSAERRGSKLSIRSHAHDEPNMDRRGSRMSVRSHLTDGTGERTTSKVSIRDDSQNEPNMDRRESRMSVRSHRTDGTGERTTSKVSIRDDSQNERNMGRRESKQSVRSHVNDDDVVKPSPRDRRERPKSAGKGGRHNEPSNLREWACTNSKGTFFLEEDGGIISHVYTLTLSEDSEIYLTIQPLRIGESGESLDGTVIDTALLILDGDDNSFVAFTESKDSRGKYSLRCSLSMGTYQLIPFTTGCRLKARRDMPTKEAKLITTDKDGKIVLTRAFKKGLEEIFEMADLDGNGLLSRDEFNWFNLRTSGDEVGDEEWQVVEDNVELEKGELTRSGFIKLNEMEADDNEGDTDDLWVTMTSMGFNKSLILDEACPFLMKVYTQDCQNPELQVTGLESSKDKINSAVCEMVIAKGENVKVRGMKDLFLHQYINDHRAIFVVENKSKTRLKMQLDCSRRRGLVSHTGSLITTVAVPAQSAVVGHHILPLEDRGEFSVSCEETVLK